METFTSIRDHYLNLVHTRRVNQKFTNGILHNRHTYHGVNYSDMSNVIARMIANMGAVDAKDYIRSLVELGVSKKTIHSWIYKYNRCFRGFNDDEVR